MAFDDRTRNELRALGVDVDKAEQPFKDDGNDPAHRESRGRIGGFLTEFDPKNDEAMSDILSGNEGSLEQWTPRFDDAAREAQQVGFKRLQESYAKLWECGTGKRAKIQPSHGPRFFEPGEDLGWVESQRAALARQYAKKVVEDHAALVEIFERIWGSRMQ